MVITEQILPLNNVLQFKGSVSRADDRRRIELNAKFRKLFDDLDKGSDYVIEVTLNKEKLLERINQLIEEKGVLPSLIWFCRK